MSEPLRRHSRVSRWAEQAATALAAIVLVGWPVAMVLHAAWTERTAAEPGLTPVEQQASLGLQTFLLVVMTLAIALPIGVMVALALFRTDLPGRTACAVLCGLSALMPIDLQGTAWLAAFGPHGLLRSLGMPLELKGLCGAAWVHAMAAIPWVVALAGAALSMVEPDLEEDCLLLAGPLRTVWHVTLRRSAGALAAAALFVAVLTASEMSVTDLLEVRTYAETVYREFAVVGRVGAATATAVPGVCVLVLLVALAGWLVARAAPPETQALFAAHPRFRLGRARWSAVAGCCLVVAMTLGVPVASLAWRAGLVFTQTRGVRGQGSGIREPSSGQAEQRLEESGENAATGPTWSPRVLVASMAASVATIGRELAYSVALAGMAMAVTVPLAWWLAVGARRGGWRRVAAGGVLCSLLALPGPVLGAGLKLALDRPTKWWGGEVGSIGAIVAQALAAVADSSAVLVWLLGLRTLPFVLLVLWPAARLVNRSVIEAAQLDGATPWQRFWHVELPACRPALFAAGFIGLVLAIGEISGTVIVAPPGLQPLTVRIFTLAHNGVENNLAGICLVLLGVAAIGSVAAVAALRRALPELE